MAFATAAALLEDVRALGLLDPPRLAEVAPLQEQFPEPRDLARELVQRHVLTPFQVNLLFQGRGRELVLGPYILLARLGEGGMGQVFKARLPRLDKVVAVKVIRKDKLQSQQAIKRFYREVHVAARLSHPHIVAALDAGEADGTLYLAMEYVEGINLSKLVKGSGPLPVAEACEYVRQAALGLQHAHEQGLVHRDVKPGNLLLTRSGGRAVVKIFDLGLARLARRSEDDSARLTRVGKVIGTPDFLAPEQARDPRLADPRADLYSLGCTLYFLLAGRTPFGHGTAGEKIVRHLLEEAPPLEQLRPDVPAGVAALVRKLMAKEPQDRCQSAAEVAAALAPYAAALRSSAAVPTAIPVAAPVVPPPGWMFPVAPPASSLQPSNSPKRLPRRWPALAACGVLLTGLAIGLIALARPSQAPDVPAPPPDEPPQQADTRPFLDRLEPTQLAPEQLPAEPLPALVAVFGDGRRRHWGAVQSLAFSPDATLLVSGGFDNAARVWDRTTGRELAVLRGPGGGVAALAFQIDGRLVTVGTADRRPGEVQRWDVAALRGQQAAPVQGHTLLKGPAGVVALSPDGQLLAVAAWKKEGNDQVGELKVWDLHSGSERATLRDPALGNALAWSHDGKLLAAASGKAIKVWAVPGAGERGPASLRLTLPGHAAGALALAFAPDGHTLASASYEAQGGVGRSLIHLWDVSGGHEPSAPRSTFHVPGQAGVLAFSPGGKVLAVGGGQPGEGRVVLWGTAESRELASLAGHAGPVTCLAFSPDGRSLASGSTDQGVRLWDVAAGKEEAPLRGPRGPAHAVAFTPDGGRIIASAGIWDQALHQWDVATGQDRVWPTRYKGAGLGLGLCEGGRVLWAFSPDGVSLWDVPTGKARATVRPGRGKLAVAEVSPDGRSVAAAGWQDSTVQLWDGQRDEAVLRATLQGHKGRVTSLAFARDGKLLATGSWDQTVRLWEVPASGERAVLAPQATLQGHKGPVVALGFSPDRRLLASAARDGTVRLWDAATGRERHTLTAAGPMTGLAFSPDGKALAAWGTQGLQLWDTVTGKELPLRGKSGPVRAAVFSPNGRALAVAGPDGRLALWRPMTGEQLSELQLPGPVHGLAFSPDSRHLATANANGTVYVLRPQELLP